VNCEGDEYAMIMKLLYSVVTINYHASNNYYGHVMMQRYHV